MTTIRKDTFRLMSADAAAGVSAMAVTACSNTEKKTEERPNIVLIMADDLGLGDISLYSGSNLVQTPRIDSLGRAGRRFDRAYATSTTSTQSRLALFTGMHPWGNGTGILPGDAHLIIEAQGRLALKEGDYVLIPAYSGSNENPTTIDFGLNPEVTLWNLANDRGQKEDISKSNKALTNKMMQSFKNIVGKAYVSDFEAEELH